MAVDADQDVTAGNGVADWAFQLGFQLGGIHGLKSQSDWMAVVEVNSLSSWDLVEEEMDDPGLAH